MSKSKHLIKKVFSAIFIFALLFSCSNIKVEKRLHRNGFHVQINNNVVKSKSETDDNNLTKIVTKKTKIRHFDKQEEVTNKLVEKKDLKLEEPVYISKKLEEPDSISKTNEKEQPPLLQKPLIQVNKKKSILNDFNSIEPQNQKVETKNPDAIINVFALISFILFILFIFFVILLLVYNITVVGLLLGILSLPLSVCIGLAILQFNEHPDKYKFQWMAIIPYYTFLVLIGLAIIFIAIVFVAVLLYFFV